MIRVVLADDARLFRTALGELLGANGCEIVGEVGDPDGLRAVVAERKPDLAIVDIRMPPTHRLEGLHAAGDIRRDHPGVSVLLLSEYVEAEHVIDLVGGVARGVGYLLKGSASGPEFLDAVRKVAAGGCVFDPEVVTAMLSKPRSRLDTLSYREGEVLSLMAQGLSNSAIATRMGVAGKTVEAHVRNVYTRLDLSDEPEHHRRVLAVLAYLDVSPRTTP